MMKKGLFIIVVGILWSVLSAQTPSEPNSVTLTTKQAKAVVITCKDMIDRGLYESIKRRASEALAAGASYLILEVSTYGGELKAADDIAKYLILDLAPQVRTVAYVTTEAISAGALISVSCQDIIMRKNTTIGDCAPITMGGTLEGVEREKVESFTRATFDRAAHANNYPQALLRAMVTEDVEVYRVRNLTTDANEFFELDTLPKDPNVYDLDNKELIDANDRILTVNAAKALEYGIARAVVSNRQEMLDFFSERDQVHFSEPVPTLETNWSEEMVRWLNHPAVVGVLTLVALLGLYVEFSAPGLGLPGLVAAIAFTILIGSKYLVGMANWVEVAIFVVGIILLLVEILVIPGFGVAGIAGIFCMLGGFFGMLIRNPPDSLPWPQSEMDWDLFMQNLLGVAIGFVGFAVVAAILSRYLPRTRLFSGLVLGTAGGGTMETPQSPPASTSSLEVGAMGRTLTPMHPAGRVAFGNAFVDCVTQGEFLDQDVPVHIIKIQGNRIVVAAAPIANEETPS